MATSGRVVWHLGGEEMGAATQWPPQKHQHQPSDKTTAQPKTPNISLVAPTNLTLHRQSVYPSLDDIWYGLLAALQK